MNGVKFIQNFVNRNPRNFEKLRLQRKPSGWQFEKNCLMRNNIYRVDFTPTKKHTSAYIVHYEDGVVLSASTTESQVSSQLYSCSDVNAAFNIGRLLGYRCLMAGITNFQASFINPDTEESQRRLSFFNALRDAGLRLIEDDHIEHSHINDPNLTYLPFRIKYTRETKLDELDLTLEPGKGVC